MRSGFFITGTDTGVGKTVVAAMFTLGLEADYWKPIQAGIEPSTDRADVAAFTGLPSGRLLPEAYRLRMPASPHWAAAAENIEIDLDRLGLPASARPLVVEGAGGVLVPLNRRALMADLMRQLALPVILVARTQLGTINHTLLSLEALRSRRLDVRGVILNGEPVPHLEATLREFGGADVLGVIPPLAEITPAALLAAFAGLAI